MTSKRIRIDVEDKDGAKFDFKIEGNVTREKVLKMFEFMELMNIEEPGEATKTDTIGGKIWHLVDKYYPTGRFTSTEILERYEDEFNEPIKLSVVSTYLSRFKTKTRSKEPKKAENGPIRLPGFQTITKNLTKTQKSTIWTTWSVILLYFTMSLDHMTSQSSRIREIHTTNLADST